MVKHPTEPAHRYQLLSLNILVCVAYIPLEHIDHKSNIRFTPSHGSWLLAHSQRQPEASVLQSHEPPQRLAYPVFDALPRRHHLRKAFFRISLRLVESCDVFERTCSLSHPCLTCFVATANVENNCINILTSIPVMTVVGGILV